MKNKLQIFIFGFIFLILSIPTLGQDFDNGEIGIALNDYGRVRVFSSGLESLVQIDRFSALLGNNISEVFDYKKDAESVDTSRTVANPSMSDYELYVSSDNAWSGLAPNYVVSVNVYGWNSGGYALAKFTFLNNDADGQTPIIGFEGIAEIDGVYGFESTEYVSDIKTMDLFVGDASTHTGFQILSHPLKTLHSIDWFDGYSDSDTLFWENLNYGSIDDLFDSGSDGSVNFMGLNPIPINLNDAAEVWVAIAVGADRDVMKANMQDATSRYETITDVKKEESGVPNSYSLNQNYPNPFNPSTKISFSLTKSEFVSLSVYNALGQEVQTLIKEELGAGNYNVDFNGSDLSSGIYFYKIVTDHFTSSKKMMLIK